MRDDVGSDMETLGKVEMGLWALTGGDFMAGNILGNIRRPLGYHTK